MRKLILLTFICILLVGCATQTKYYFSGEFSSSGASREYNASITFEGNAAISGQQRYEVWSVLGDHFITNCTILGGAWKDNNTNADCNISIISLPTEKDKLLLIMKEKNFTPVPDCGHGRFCYQKYIIRDIVS